jgi:hypothetical protein
VRVKLFIVSYGGEAYVLADDRASALKVIDRMLRRGCDLESDADSASEVTDIKHVPKLWREEMPYSETLDNRTIEEILEGK